MLRTNRTPLMGMDSLQTPTSSAQYQKPTFQPGSTIYEVHGPNATVSNRFRCGRLLGRGGFAKCYEVQDAKGTFALKAINRASLDKPKTLQKLHSEIAIHNRMKHKHVVNFIRTFKDRYYVYILLEMCDNGTLMDMLKVRPLNVAETQFVMLQLLAGMQYLHDQNVIHRDLKPGNIMLDSGLNVKIGDFGLAAELTFDGERKRTVCGTPNYIAPEIIDRKSHGHSFEVDIWSLGVIFYTLLVGQPPFQMEDVESTYSRIRACRYDFPASVPESARDLIRGVLQSTPTNRPTLLDIRTHPFFSSPIPPTVPPASFAQFRVTMPTTSSISNTNNNNNNNYRRASAPADCEGYAKNANGPAQREVFRPINANNHFAPLPGGPVSPRTNVNVVQKLPPPPLNNFMENLNNNNNNNNNFRPRATSANVANMGTAASPPPPPPPATTSATPSAFPMRRHTLATATTTAATAAGSDANGQRRSIDTWRAGGGYDLQLPQIDTRVGGTPPKEDNKDRNGNANRGGMRRYGQRAAEADEEEDRRQLTQLHDRLHQTLCLHDDDPHPQQNQPQQQPQYGGEKRRDAAKPQKQEEEEEVVGPLPEPQVWVTDCADFSSKYGLCYRLSTGQTGAHYNDSTKMIWEPITGRAEYYARLRVEMTQANGDTVTVAKDELEIFNISDYPSIHEKKVTLIKYFKTYLSRTRTPKDKVEVVACSRYVPASPPRLSDPHVSEDFVYVKRWLRTPEALVFRLSNKTVQVCFNDFAEVILSSEWKVVTFTDPTGTRRTLPLNSVATDSAEAAERLRYTKTILYKLIKDHCL